MEKNKVLIVDDIPENIETISEMIKDFDIDVKTANGGKYNPQNEMFSHSGMKRYNFKNETQLFKVIPHTSKIQKNRPASPERNTFEGS